MDIIELAYQEREDWTAVQYLVRLVAVLQWGVGELAKAVSAPVQIGTRRHVRPPWLKIVRAAAFSARTEIENREDAWDLARINDLEVVKEALASLQVLLFCAARAVRELDGGEFDVVEAALGLVMSDKVTR